MKRIKTVRGVDTYEAADGKQVVYIRFSSAGKTYNERVGEVVRDKRGHDTTSAKARRLLQQRREEIRAAKRAGQVWRSEAEQRELDQQQAEADAEADQGPTFKDFVATFLKDYKGSARRGKLRSDHYRYNLSAAAEILADKLMQEIVPADLETFRVDRAAMFLERRGREMSGSSMRKELSALGTLFSVAVKWGVIEATPAADLEKPSEPKHRTDYVTEAEEKLILDASPPRLRRVIRWAISTGMDRAEIVALDWNQIDLAAGTVYAPRAKTGVVRNIPLNETLRGILKGCQQSRTVIRKSGPVFLNDKDEPLTVAAVQMMLRRVVKKLDADLREKLRGQPFKIFRHTFGSRLAMAGNIPQTIAALMGHTSTAMTDRYMHLSPAYLREAMTGMDTYRPPEAGNRDQNRAGVADQSADRTDAATA